MITSEAPERQRPSPDRTRGRIPFSGKLFHGTATMDISSHPLLDTSIDYSDLFTRQLVNSAVWNKVSESGVTLGPGYYAVDKQHQVEADNYANERAIQSGAQPAVRELFIDNAHFYDFRDRENIERNVPVPLEMVKSWLSYYKMNRRKIANELLPKKRNPYARFALRLSLLGYERYLQHFIANLEKGERVFSEGDITKRSKFIPYGVDRYTLSKRGFDLRSMLRTHIGDHDFNNPLHGGLWVRFVKEQLNCDGIILIEGGEGKDFKNAPTYVLYNLKKIADQTLVAIDSSGKK